MRRWFRQLILEHKIAREIHTQHHLWALGMDFDKTRLLDLAKKWKDA
jgi:hypothetical protein